MRHRIVSLALFLSMLLSAPVACAKAFPRPKPGDQFIGHRYTVTVKKGESMSSISRAHDIGFNALVYANPGIDPKKLEVGTVLIIPDQHLLPPKPWRGIIANLPQMRLMYFPEHGETIYTYPIGIRRAGWDTPLGKMKITEKRKNPVWIVPKSVQKDLAKRGIRLPDVVRSGPNNPLGHYAMRLSYPTYLIHGTNDPNGVGRRVTAGCLRMFPEDIAELFNKVSIGEPVRILNRPFQLTRSDDHLMLTVFKPIDHQTPAQWAPVLANALDRWTSTSLNRIDWSAIDLIIKHAPGQPMPIGQFTIGKTTDGTA